MENNSQNPQNPQENQLNNQLNERTEIKIEEELKGVKSELEKPSINLEKIKREIDEAFKKKFII